MITGVAAVWGSLRSSRSTSLPLLPGIIMSSRITSGRALRERASASSPSEASTTV